MGLRGPIGKNPEQRVRRNKETDEVTVIKPGAQVEIPDLDVDPADVVEGEMHPIARDLYNSLKYSGQNSQYQASDWQVARYVCHLLSGVLHSGRPSAQMVAAVNTLLSNLLLTEGDRRRVKLEIEREGAVTEVVDIAKLLQERMENDLAI